MARGTRVQRKYKLPGGKSRKMLNVKIAAFFIMMLIFGVIALIIPLRPTESVVEKRELTKFPEFSFQALADGSYFKQVDLWFSDTFPFRDAFTSANARLKSLYGIHPATVHGEVTTGDAIPEKPTKPVSSNGSSNASSQASSASSAESSSSEASSKEEKPIPTTTLNAVLLAGDSAFEYYNFNLEVADQYAATVNNITQKLQGKAVVYDMIVPTSIDIMLPESTRAGLNTDDQKKAIDYMYGSMLDETKKVNIYDTLMSHNDEYLYFRTDHHWTSLGAYYAYQQLCGTLSLTPFDPAAHTALTAENFYGTHYSKARTWNAVPDTITYYDLPNSLTIYNVTAAGQPADGQTTGLYDTDKLNVYDKYAMFLHGNNGLSRIEGDGTGRILVIKDSYANCFAPYLTANYAQIDVVDFRNYNYGLDQLIADNDYDQILVLYSFDSFKSDPYLYRAGVAG